MRKQYTPQQRAEIVALAVVAGAETAATKHGADVRSVRKWMVAAGHTPASLVEPAGWRQLLDLAQAQVAGALAAGNVRAKDAAVIAAIAERNLRQLDDPERRQAEPQEPWTHRFDRWCDESYASASLAEVAK